MKRLIATALLALSLFAGSGLVAAPVYADSTDSAKSQACAGITQTGGSCGGGAGLTKTVKAIINVVSMIAGILAVIMIIVSGMRYITSGGDAQAVSGAKKTLIYAVVGLIVVAFAQIIVHFVLKNAQ